MTDPRPVRPAPDLPDERRSALVFGNGNYTAGFAKLGAPANDARAMAAVLADRELCGFRVGEPRIDLTTHQMKVELAQFLAAQHTDDLCLIYFSGHGEVDLKGRLYLAGTDSQQHQLLSATSVDGDWLLEAMDRSHANRVVLILDCCYSGAFGRRAKAGADPIGKALGKAGRGTFVLSGSRPAQPAWMERGGHASTFTTALLTGIRTGDADTNNDGLVYVIDAYQFAHEAMRTARPEQTPQFLAVGMEGVGAVLSRSPAGIRIGAATLDEDLRRALDNGLPEIRIAAIGRLAEDLHNPDPTVALAATNELNRISLTDVAAVATAARRALQPAPATADSVPDPAGHATPPDRRRPTPRPARRTPTRLGAPDDTGEAEPIQWLDFDGLDPDPPHRYPIDDDDSDHTNEPFTDADELMGLAIARIGRPRPPIFPQPSSLVSRYLIPTEKYRGEWRRHWIVLAQLLLLGTAAGLMAWYAPAHLPWPLPVDLHLTEAQAGQALRYLGIATAVAAGWQVGAWWFTRLVLTNKRLISRRGLLRVRLSEVSIPTTPETRAGTTLLGRLLNYGTISARNSGNRRHRHRWVPNWNDVYLQLVEEIHEPEAVEARLGALVGDDYY